jgi:hypothetical protein
MDEIPVDGVALLTVLEYCVLGLSIVLLEELLALLFSINSSKDLGTSISSKGSCRGTHDSWSIQMDVPIQSLETFAALLFDDFLLGDEGEFR